MHGLSPGLLPSTPLSLHHTIATTTHRSDVIKWNFTGQLMRLLNIYIKDPSNYEVLRTEFPDEILKFSATLLTFHYFLRLWWRRVCQEKAISKLLTWVDGELDKTLIKKDDINKFYLRNFFSPSDLFFFFFNLHLSAFRFFFSASNTFSFRIMVFLLLLYLCFLSFIHLYLISSIVCYF